MSQEQQRRLDAILRQGQFDSGADVQTLRTAFNELMAQVPVAPDVQQNQVPASSSHRADEGHREILGPAAALYADDAADDTPVDREVTGGAKRHDFVRPRGSTERD